MATTASGGKQQLIDIHVHGAESYDTRTRRQDDILQMAAIHGERGTSVLLPTVYPGPIEAMRESMTAIRCAMTAQRSGARIQGIHLEGPFLNPERAGSLDKTVFSEPSIEALKRLVGDFEDLIRIVTIAPELPGALHVIEACREMGFLVHMGHSDATYEQAEEGKRACIETIRALAEIEGVAGVHVMGHRNANVLAEIIAEVRPRTLAA